jgi:hypothetical protein
VTFTAWRNTPLEDAAREFLLARAGLPLGALLFTFGTPRHADDDGWTAETGSIALAPGALKLTTDATGRITLVSPRGLALAPERIGRIVAGLPREAKVDAMNVYARSAGGAAWEPVALSRPDTIVVSDAGRVVARSGPSRAAPADQIKLEFRLGAAARDVPLTRVAVLPPPPSR